MQEAFRDLGMSVPRDTDMQRDAIGRAPEIANVADLRRNDLIFVPGHVMICAGEESVLHAYGGDMTVRRDRLADLVQANRWNVADFTVRRLA